MQFNLEELINLRINISPTAIQRIVADMPKDQLIYMNLFATGIQEPDEIWLQKQTEGHKSENNWHRIYVTRFEIEGSVVATVSRFQVIEAWELFSMEAITGDGLEIINKLNASHRHGHKIYPI